MFGQHRRYTDAGEIIVGQRRVARVGGDQDLVPCPALEEELGICQEAVLQSGIDDNLVNPVLHVEKVVVAQAEAPILPVIRGSIGNPIGVGGQRVEMAFELSPGHRLSDGDAVANDMKIRPAEVDDSFSARVLDIGVADVPFLRNGPVENLFSRGDLMDFEGGVPFQDSQGLAETRAGDAPADGIELRHQPEDLRANIRSARSLCPEFQIHRSLFVHPPKSGKLRSLSEMILISAGQAMAKAGSFQRKPRWLSGA